MEIIISPLNRSDIPAVLNIEIESQPEPWTEKSFLEELARLHSHLFAARPVPDSNSGPACDIIGYICFWCVAEEIQILNLAVQKEWRRKSVGRNLLLHALRTGCENAQVATLEVRSSNIAARRLYESLGFNVTGERPGYYGPQESAILMQLEISAKFDKNTG